MADDLNQVVKQFGEKVREERKQVGISQEDLAEETGLDRTYIGGIERGERNPSLRNIAKIARALRISLKQLFSFN